MSRVIVLSSFERATSLLSADPPQTTWRRLQTLTVQRSHSGAGGGMTRQRHGCSNNSPSLCGFQNSLWHSCVPEHTQTQKRLS